MRNLLPDLPWTCLTHPKHMLNWSRIGSLIFTTSRTRQDPPTCQLFSCLIHTCTCISSKFLSSPHHQHDNRLDLGRNPSPPISPRLRQDANSLDDIRQDGDKSIMQNGHARLESTNRGVSWKHEATAHQASEASFSPRPKRTSRDSIPMTQKNATLNSNVEDRHK
jgi:hypothetical protein